MTNREDMRELGLARARRRKRICRLVQASHRRMKQRRTTVTTGTIFEALADLVSKDSEFSATPPDEGEIRVMRSMALKKWETRSAKLALRSHVE